MGECGNRTRQGEIVVDGLQGAFEHFLCYGHCLFFAKLAREKKTLCFLRCYPLGGFK